MNLPHGISHIGLATHTWEKSRGTLVLIPLFCVVRSDGKATYVISVNMGFSHQLSTVLYCGEAKFKHKKYARGERDGQPMVEHSIAQLGIPDLALRIARELSGLAPDQGVETVTVGISPETLLEPQTPCCVFEIELRELPVDTSQGIEKLFHEAFQAVGLYAVSVE